MDLDGFLYKWVIGSKTLDTVHDCFLKEYVTLRYITSSTSVYGIRGRLSTSRTWMLTLAFKILNCVYLWTKAMKKLTGNLIEEDSSQCLKILSQYTVKKMRIDWQRFEMFCLREMSNSFDKYDNKHTGFC